MIIYLYDDDDNSYSDVVPAEGRPMRASLWDYVIHGKPFEEEKPSNPIPYYLANKTLLLGKTLPDIRPRSNCLFPNIRGVLHYKTIISRFWDDKSSIGQFCAKQ